jgi:hypothetical protein
MTLVLKKNEDNENEILASLKPSGFELIPEDDESLLDDDFSQN